MKRGWSGGRIARGFLLAVGLSLMLTLTPTPAFAHAAFVSSDPEPGAELPSAPGVVVLRFSEPLIARLSRANVSDPALQLFEGRVTAEREITVPLGTNALGVYRVEWTTVSPVDGHTLRGFFRFGVGVAPGEDAEGDTGAEPGAGDLAVAVARAIEYGSLLLAVGMVVLGRLARRNPPLVWVRTPTAWVVGAALASGVTVILGEASLATGLPWPGNLAAYFGSGLAAAARLTRVGAEALGLVIVFRRRSPFFLLVVAIVGVAGAGHAAAVSPRWWGVGAGALHLVASGVWAGGIMALATVRPPGGWRGRDGLALLARFSPLALTAFVATVGFGVIRGFQELSGLSDLIGTSYGRVLALKALGVVLMAQLSAMLWLRLLATPRAEAVLAGVVIALAALLAAYPLPPGRLSEAGVNQRAQSGTTALPRGEDLTLGDSAGEVLVGLTIRPAVAGQNDVLVYILPLEGEEAAAGLPVRVSAGGPLQATEECGLTCRRARLELLGGERVEVHVAGKGGGVAAFEIPRLPPEDGALLYRKMQERMHALRTYRLEEILSSGRAVIKAKLEFEAPDRMRARLDSGFERVIVGEREWRREGPAGPWRADAAIRLQVPRFIWDFGGEPVALRVVGTERLQGAKTTILSFAGRSGGFAIWYRLWVDAEGLVRRAEMRAQGHFMDHGYFDFDDDIEIGPPA